ncbi:MAG: hypothetical protein ABIB61_01635 [Candidatus Shapirobacteria bacterium]
MAGYDYSFKVDKKWKPLAREFLVYSLNIAKSLGLETHFKSLSGNESFYVNIDGPLQQMQAFEEDSSRASDYFIRSRFPIITLKRVQFYDKVLRPYFTANSEGLMGITDKVFRDAQLFGAQVIGRVLSPKVYRLLNKRGLSQRSKKAIISIIEAHYNFLLGEANEDMLISVDGSIENILKDRLGGVFDRAHFPVVVNNARNSRLITAHQSRRLTVLHRHRNPVQHAGRNVNKAKLRSYIRIAVEIVERLS